MTWGGTPILWSDGFSVAGVRKPTAGRGSERGEGLSRSEIGSSDLSPLSLSLPPSACWSICPWDNFIRGVLTMKIVDLPSRPSLRPSSLFGCPNLSPLFPSLPFPSPSPLCTWCSWGCRRRRRRCRLRRRRQRQRPPPTRPAPLNCLPGCQAAFPPPGCLAAWLSAQKKLANRPTEERGATKRASKEGAGGSEGRTMTFLAKTHSLCTG